MLGRQQFWTWAPPSPVLSLLGRNLRAARAGGRAASWGQPRETRPSPCLGGRVSRGLCWGAVWALTWPLSGGGAGPGLLQEGAHAGPVLQVGGQGGVPGLEEGLRGQAATAALVPGVL